MASSFALRLLSLAVGLFVGGGVFAADPPPAPAAEAPAFDPLAVPQTTELQPLLKYIDQVGKWQLKITPEMRQNKEAMATAKGQMVASRMAMISAIDKALALQPAADDRTKLVHDKFNALRTVSSLTDDEKLEKQVDQDYEALAKTLLNDKDPELARYAYKIMLGIRMNHFAEGTTTESLDSLLADLTTAVESNETRNEAIGLANNLTYILEMKGQYETSKNLHNMIISNAAKLADPRMQKQVASRAQGGLSRIGLIGQEPDLKGIQTDGKPFDVAALKGKVVLIDFWATWCGPCRAELPNVLKNYEQYHKAGFEVVGISIDDDRSKLDDFLKEQPLPWISLFNPDEATRGFEDPTARKFFVNGIPATYLIDPSGKLVHINVRGERLGELLKTYYPEVK